MRRKMSVAVSMLTLVMSLVGCGLSGDGGSGKNDKDAELEIEMSASKTTIEVGETTEVEIENFDDLRKVEIEVDDEDIAEAELDDGTITIEGREEGKTMITVSAKECEDVTVTVKVTAPVDVDDDDDTVGGETGSGNNTGDNGGHASGGGIELPSEARLYEHYVAEIPYDVWGGFLDMGDADEYTIAVMEMFKKCNITFNAEMNLDLSNATEGTGEFVVDLNDFMGQFRVAMQDEDLFIEFMELMYDEPIDSETKEALLEMQDDFIDMLVTDEENIVTEFDWSYDSANAMLTFSEGSRGGAYYIQDDGSFEYKAGDGATDVWLTFVPVK